MPRTKSQDYVLINTNLKQNKNWIILNQHYLHIFNHLNENFCQELVCFVYKWA